MEKLKIKFFNDSKEESLVRVMKKEKPYFEFHKLSPMEIKIFDLELNGSEGILLKKWGDGTILLDAQDFRNES